MMSSWRRSGSDWRCYHRHQSRLQRAAEPGKLKNYTDGLNQNNGLYLVLGTLEGAIERCGAPTFAP